MISAIPLAVLAILTTLPSISGHRRHGLDVIFAIDDSASQTDENFAIARDLISDIIAGIPNFGGDGNRASVMQYSDHVVEHFGLDTFSDSAIAAEKTQTMRSGEGTHVNTHKAIEAAKERFDRLGLNRNFKVLFIITHSNPDDVNATQFAAETFMETPMYYIMTLAIGNNYNPEELQAMSDFIIHTNGYDVLPILKKTFLACAFTIRKHGICLKVMSILAGDIPTGLPNGP